MAFIEGDIIIARPAETVFDFAADQRNEPRYNPRMARAEKVTGGPVGKGTVFRSAVRAAGRATDMRSELTGYRRPPWLASRTTMAQADIAGTLNFEPVPGGESTDDRTQLLENRSRNVRWLQTFGDVTAHGDGRSSIPTTNDRVLHSDLRRPDLRERHALTSRSDEREVRDSRGVEPRVSRRTSDHLALFRTIRGMPRLGLLPHAAAS